MFLILQLMCKLNVSTLSQVLVEQYLIEIAKNYSVPYKSKTTLMDEARSDLVGVGLAEDVKKGTLGRRSGTVVGPGEPPGAWPVPAPGPLPVPSPAPCFSSLPPESQNDSYKKNDLLPSPIPSLGLIPQTSPKPESRVKIGFDKFMLPGLPDVKPQGSLSIDPCGFEEVDFEDLNRRLEMLKKTTQFLCLGLSNCLRIRAPGHKFRGWLPVCGSEVFLFTIPYISFLWFSVIMHMHVSVCAYAYNYSSPLKSCNS